LGNQPVFGQALGGGNEQVVHKFYWSDSLLLVREGRNHGQETKSESEPPPKKKTPHRSMVTAAGGARSIE